MKMIDTDRDVVNRSVLQRLLVEVRDRCNTRFGDLSQAEMDAVQCAVDGELDSLARGVLCGLLSRDVTGGVLYVDERDALVRVVHGRE